MSTKIDGRFMLKLELYLFLVASALVNFNLLPTSALYLFDVINLFVCLVCFKRCRIAFSGAKWIVTIIDILLLYNLISAAASTTLIQYVMWELNAVFRIFIFLFIWVAVCRLEDLKEFLHMLYRFQILNFLFACVEFFIMGLQGDNCGGLFGIVSGCNSYANIYLCIVCGYAMNSYLAHGRVNIASLIATCLMSLAVATFSEIKFFYFEFVIILIVSLLANRFSRKTALLVVAGAALLAVGLNLLSIYYPESYELLFDVEAMAAYDDGSQVATSGYGISRSAPIPQVNAMFFSSDDVEKMFGMGFGSATVSSIDFFASSFYHEYDYLRYYYSPIAMIYIQTGWIGLILYLSVFVCMIIYTIHLRSRFKRFASDLYGFTLVMQAIFVSNCFYNATSRASIAILWAVVLSATVFVGGLSKCNQDEWEEESR